MEVVGVLEKKKKKKSYWFVISCFLQGQKGRKGKAREIKKKALSDLHQGAEFRKDGEGRDREGARRDTGRDKEQGVTVNVREKEKERGGQRE